MHTKESPLSLTEKALDLLNMEYYVGFDKPLEESMTEIQSDFMYDHLPPEAMALFRRPEFRQDVFRFMDIDDFENYLRHRYESGEEPDVDWPEFCTAV